jgi:hypothetical protein
MIFHFDIDGNNDNKDNRLVQHPLLGGEQNKIESEIKRRTKKVIDVEKV